MNLIPFIVGGLFAVLIAAGIVWHCVRASDPDDESFGGPL